MADPEQLVKWQVRIAEMQRELGKIHREIASEQVRVRREARLSAKRELEAEVGKHIGVRYVGVQFAEDLELKPEIWTYIDGLDALKIGDRVICPTRYGSRNGIVTRLWGHAVPNWVDWKGPYDRITQTGWM